MEIYWVIACAALFLYSYYWYRRPSRFPPGPRGIPALGVIPFLGKNPEKTIRKWSKIYGPIMTVRMGTEDQVLLNSYDVIMQALVKQSNVFSGRPHNPFIDQITSGHGIIFVDYSEKWKSQRRFGLTTLRSFGFGKRSMESRIIEEVSYLNDSIRSENGKAFDIQNLLKYSVSNITCNLVMGKRFEYDDPQFHEVIEKLFNSVSDPVANAMLSMLILAPWLRHVPFFSHYNNSFIKNYKSDLNLFQGIVKEHEDTYDDKEMRDFVDTFIKEMKTEKDITFSNEQLIQYIRDLFEAGTETTSTTLAWSILCFLHFPQTQNKIREEIENVLGSDGAISMSNKNDMPYTNAFIQEVYRFRTFVPLSLPHMTNEDSELGGYFIPKGTTILPNLWAVHNDVEVFEEPEKFKPERFLDEKGNFLPSNHVIPFSIGPRHCLGEQLARMEVFIFLVGMIQKFEFLPDPSADRLPDIEGRLTGHVYVNAPYKVTAKEI